MADDNSSEAVADEPENSSEPQMPQPADLDIDLSAFARAQQLLARNEHLDNAEWEKKQSRSKPRPPRRPVVKKPPPTLEDFPADLPSLAELSQAQIISKPKPANHGR